jgi:hypothetical protein
MCDAGLVEIGDTDIKNHLAHLLATDAKTGTYLLGLGLGIYIM